MKKVLNFLIIEDSQNDFLLVERQLKKGGLPAHCSCVDRLEDLNEALDKSGWNVVISDYSIPRLNFLDTLNLVQTRLPDVPVILVSGSIGEEKAVELLKLGVWDFVLKDNLVRLVPVIEHSLKEAGDRRARQAAENALRESEARLKLALAASQMGVWEWDLRTNAIFWSPECYQIIGIENSDGGLSSFTKVLHPDDAARVVTAAEKAVMERAVYEAESRIVRPNGEIRWVSNLGRAEYDENGEALRLIGTVQDITGRKRAEEAMASLRRQQELILSSAGEGILGLDHEGKVSFINRAAQRLIGWEPQDLLGKPFHEMAHHTKSTGIPHRIEECPILLAQKEGIQCSVEADLFWRQDGSSFPVAYTAAPMGEMEGHSGLVLIFRDITERLRAEERVKRKIDHLAALRSIDMAITASLDLRVTFNVFLEQVITQLRVDAADIFLLDRYTQELEFASGRGFRTYSLQHTHLSLGEGYAGRAAVERKIIHVSDLREPTNPWRLSPFLAKEGFVTYYAVPLIAKGQVQGILELFHRSNLETNQEWLDFMEALAGQAAIAIDNTTLYADLQHSNMELVQAYDSTLEGWSRALDLRDKETEGHSKRVTEMTVRLARRLGVSGAELVHVRRGALLHDIGKVGIPDSVLLKPGPLNEEEWVIMRKHPVYARELLHPTVFLRPAIDIPYCHHEKWDGTGYPLGLVGEQIPLMARIFSLADVWDALTSDRPYRPAWSEERTLKHIRGQVGQHFDPKVVEAFEQLLKERPTPG